jgi:dipeptidyl aminopeptidase/acylaminoacyl peptidase
VSQEPPETSGGRSRRRALGAIGLGAGLAMGAYGVLSYLVYDRLSAAPGTCWDRDRLNTPDAYAVPIGFDQAIADANRMPVPVDVAFSPRDPRASGLALRGWWIPAEDPRAPAVILVHGVMSCRREANVLIPAGMLHRHGFSVLVFDLRNHGDSDDETGRTAAGNREYRDVLGAWDWLTSLGIEPSRIGILGVSFGAACAIIAGGEDDRVAAVWADSSWAEVGSLLRHFLVQAGKPAAFAPGAIRAARFVTGDDLLAMSPLAAIGRTTGGALALVHGAADPDILPVHAMQLREAALASGADLREFWITPGAGHTEAVYREPAQYEARMVRFFGGALGEPSRGAGPGGPRLGG